MRLALDDPLYRQVFGAGSLPDEVGRLTGYTNLLLEFWTMLWEFGDVSEPQLRLNLTEILGTDAGRAYWEYAGNLRPAGASSRREREFHRIADEIYRLGGGRSPRGSQPQAGNSRGDRRKRTASRAGNCVILAVAGGAVISVIRRRRSGDHPALT